MEIIAHLLSAKRRSVQEQLHLFRIGIDLHGSRLSLIALPCPAVYRVCEIPPTDIELLAEVLHPVNGNIGNMLPSAPDDFPPIGHGSAESGQVKIAIGRRKPWIVPHECAAVLVLGGNSAAARFSQIVHRGPAEISQHIGVALYSIPVFVQGTRERLGAKENPLRMQRMFPLIAFVAVVIADHVQQIAGLLHIGIQHGAGGNHAHHIRRAAGGSDNIVDPVLCLILHDLLEIGNARYHNIDSVGNKAGMVQRTELFRQLSSPLRPQGLSGLRDLIADGPENNAGVVVIPAHHGFHIRLPTLREVLGIVKGRFVLGPDIRKLVHNQHAILVTGIQQSRAGGIVGGPQRIVAHALVQQHPASLRVIHADRTQQAIVMVHASALELYALAVDPQAVNAVQLQLADTEGGLGRIHGLLRLPIDHLTIHAVEVRRIHIPKRGLFKMDALAHRHPAIAVHIESCLTPGHLPAASVMHCELYIALPAPLPLILQLGLDLQHCQLPVAVQCRHMQTVRSHMQVVAGKDPGIPVDTLAGVPAGIRQIGAANRHLQGIGGIIAQVAVDPHAAGGVAIAEFLNKGSVDEKRRVHVHAVEVEIMHLVLFFHGNNKLLDVDNVLALKKGHIHTGRRIRSPLHCNHCVMRKGHIFLFALGTPDTGHDRAQPMLYHPILVKALFLHELTSCFQKNGERQASPVDKTQLTLPARHLPGRQKACQPFVLPEA